MTEVLTRACYFIAIILMGYGLRKVGFFKKEDFHILSQIVTKITLTAAIISSFGGKKFEPGMLALILFGFLFGVVLMLVAWILNHHKDKDTLAFMVLNIAGCNIGNFVLPFAMSFLGPLGVIAIGLFDAGNSIICLGGSYGVASMIKNGEKKETDMDYSHLRNSGFYRLLFYLHQPVLSRGRDRAFRFGK